jgi:hypothetical protein
VQICLTRCRERRIGRILVVSLMLILWLGTAALAASPELHHRLHPDSKSPTHECLVTLLSKSHLLAGAAGSFILALIPVFFGLLLLAESSRCSVIDYRLSPSRAPPSGFSSSTVVG